MEISGTDSGNFMPEQTNTTSLEPLLSSKGKGRATQESPSPILAPIRAYQEDRTIIDLNTLLLIREYIGAPSDNALNKAMDILLAPLEASLSQKIVEIEARIMAAIMLRTNNNNNRPV
ncbi:hypothetical protein L873DRAFT_1790985 [Choiromyces venosus 120613-1]|uniref:Uncharacterized protein n=1 Tax=Choiromyces venosus 120613-1 TaxID=1336337 RepID=A0A3N4JJR1_9PEZI|nr:hypothetical protein L873DRAFT_1790985 [Choiromyces venosus 120613-1]